MKTEVFNHLRKKIAYSVVLLKEDESLRAINDFKTHQFIMENAKKYFGETLFNKPLRILDLGCGKRYPESYLYALDGHYVTGLDIMYTVSKGSLTQYYHSLRCNGFLDTARCIQLDAMRKRKKFRRLLEELSGKKANRKINFMVGDAEKLTGIKNNSFDLVVSKDLFEHIPDPLAAIKRIREVLVPNGYTIHNIHLFTAITGGHNPQWNDFKEYQAWDHLRNHKFVLPGLLNKWRVNDYISAFQSVFKTVNFEFFSYVEDDVNSYLNSETWSEIHARHPDLQRDELLHDKLIVFASA